MRLSPPNSLLVITQSLRLQRIPPPLLPRTIQTALVLPEPLLELAVGLPFLAILFSLRCNITVYVNTSFSFRISDGSASSASGNFALTINPVDGCYDRMP